MNDLILAIKTYVIDPENPEYNYQLALAYDKIDQTASASTFYMRAAELTDIKELSYECLIKFATCFEKQGYRTNTVSVMLKHAITLFPKRPEAYFILSRVLERTNDYVEGYTYAQIGLEVCDFNLQSLRSNVEYPGKWGLIFEKAVCSWWWGKSIESRKLFLFLLDNHYDEMDKIHKESVERNLVQLGSGRVDISFKTYTKKKHDRLRFKFNGSSEIKNNYAQAYQDMFVLSMLNGKRNGTYLELGSADPFYGSCTALLENQFGWNGIGVEFQSEIAQKHVATRKNKVLNQDARYIDYNEVLSNLAIDGVVDYLQLDCDPSSVTYEILTKIPFDTYKFAVLTYEHDHYVDLTRSYRDKSRELLISKGYKLIVGNVGTHEGSPFEDWWVHPDLVDAEIIKKMQSHIDGVNVIEEYMLPKKLVIIDSANKPIHTMGTLIVNGVHWLNRLMDSIDYPIENYVIFNNNGRGQITKELEEIVSKPHPFIKNIKLCHLPANIGVSTGWNLIIKSYVMSPYWFIVSHDVAFTPGFLAGMAEQAENSEIGLIHGSSDECRHGYGSWDLFLIKDWVIQSHGLFDENLTPAYCEDLDYMLRAVKNPIKKGFVQIPHLHGNKDEDYMQTGSQTWRTELALEDKLKSSNFINKSYLIDKWGDNSISAVEQGTRIDDYSYNSTPFNKEFPISYTSFDLKFIRKKYLGF